MILRRLPAFVVLAAASSLASCSESTVDAARSSVAMQPAKRGTDAAASPPGSDAVANARAFLAALDDDQRGEAVFGFDHPDRTAWDYVPRARRGLPLADMEPAQREALFALVGSGLSPRGTDLVRGIVELEGTLRDIELAALNPFGLRRDPGLYFAATFGAPGELAPWAWSFEGHHVSVNVTRIDQGEPLVAPLFMGANPARVPRGPQAGLRLLAAEEDLAFALLDSLDARQRERAVISETTFGDIVTRSDPVVAPMDFAGLPADEMTPGQQQGLRKLLDVYAGRMQDAAAASQWRRIEAAGFGRLHFAWAGAQRPGRPHYYRLHGPTVLVEYDNSQGGADHIHTVWRDLQNDFGGDLLRRHYAAGSGNAGHAHD